jgi:hypothetical protein
VDKKLANCVREKIIKKILKKVLTNAHFHAIIKVQKRDTKEVNKMTTYKVTWKEMWTAEEMTFTDVEEAKKWAKMKKAMNYKEVKLVKVETTEMEF